MDFIAVKSLKARGKRLTTYTVDKVEELEPREVEDVEEDDTEAILPDEEPATESEERSDDEVRDEINGQQRIF